MLSQSHPSQAGDLLKTDRYNEYDRMHFKCGVKPSVLPAAKILNQKTSDLFQKFRVAVQNLVQCRNRILQLQCEFKHTDDPYDYGITAENVVAFMEYADKRLHDDGFDVYSVYGVPKRKISKRGMDMVTEEHLNEITDSEIDEDIEDEIGEELRAS